MLRDITPAGCATRIAADSQSYMISCLEYMIIGCMKCGYSKQSIIFTKEGRLPSEYEFMENWLKQQRRCLCSRTGGKHEH